MTFWRGRRRFRIRRFTRESGTLFDVAKNVTGGWDVHTGILVDLLNGVNPRPFWTTHDRLAKEYAAPA